MSGTHDFSAGRAVAMRVAPGYAGRGGERRAVTSHAMFWIVGMMVGAATVGMIGKGFVEERGMRLVPLFWLLAAICGLIVGWALNAWSDYIDFTGNGGGATGL